MCVHVCVCVHVCMHVCVYVYVCVCVCVCIHLHYVFVNLYFVHVCVGMFVCMGMDVSVSDHVCMCPSPLLSRVTRLPALEDQDLVVKITPNAQGTEVTYFAIWCRSNNVSSKLKNTSNVDPKCRLNPH